MPIASRKFPAIDSFHGWFRRLQQRVETDYYDSERRARLSKLVNQIGDELSTQLQKRRQLERRGSSANLRLTTARFLATCAVKEGSCPRDYSGTEIGPFVKPEVSREHPLLTALTDSIADFRVNHAEQQHLLGCAKRSFDDLDVSLQLLESGYLQTEETTNYILKKLNEARKTKGLKPLELADET